MAPSNLFGGESCSNEFEPGIRRGLSQLLDSNIRANGAVERILSVRANQSHGGVGRPRPTPVIEPAGCQASRLVAPEQMFTRRVGACLPPADTKIRHCEESAAADDAAILSVVPAESSDSATTENQVFSPSS